MVNATTMSHPKEMLGYLIVQHFSHILEVTKMIYYDRKAALTVTALLGTLDAIMQPFHSDMFFVRDSKKIGYVEAKKEINEKLTESQTLLYEKNYTSYLEAISMWETLIASVFPLLGLVPESPMERQDDSGLIEDDPSESIPNDGEIELEPR